MSDDDELIGTKTAAAILGIERSNFTKKVLRDPPLVEVAMRGSGPTGEKFFRRADVEAAATERRSA